MIRLVIVAVMVLSTIVVAYGQEVQLSLDLAKVQMGQSVKLKWSIGKADKAFVSEVGKTTSDGTKELTPDRTTTYTLIAEGKFGVLYRTATIEVEGSRGNDPNDDTPPTDFSKYKYPLITKRKGASVVDVLEQIRQVLQDDMEFSVYGPLPSLSGNITFVTNFKHKRELVKSDEKTIAERKISHLVEVDRVTNSTGECALTIKALVKYRKARESTWRDERNEEFYRPESENLKKKIDGLPK